MYSGKTVPQRIPLGSTKYPVENKDLTWILYKAIKGESKMAVEFSRRPLLSLLLSLWMSIFNLNSSCNWLEGWQGGTLLVDCAVPHRSQCAGFPLPLKKHFCCNAEIPPPPIRCFIFLHFSMPLFFTAVCTRGDVKKALWEIISGVVIFHLCRNVFRLCCILKEAQAVCPKTMWLYLTDIYNSTLWRLCYRLTHAWRMNSFNYTGVPV